MAIKCENSETDALFNQEIINRHMKIAATGGLTGLRKLTAQQTGYANFGDEEELKMQLKANPYGADQTLVLMSNEYGQENLEKMQPSEFYRLYKDYALGKV